jgi:hypothetical protein
VPEVVRQKPAPEVPDLVEGLRAPVGDSNVHL